MLQTLRGKQKYHVTNVGIEKITLSRLPVQRNNEFKMNEIQSKTSQLRLKSALTNSNIVSYCLASNGNIHIIMMHTHC